jgi:hypothetical protein
MESGGISPLFLASALDWGEWSASCPGRYTLGEGAPPPITVLKAVKRNRTRVTQCLASRYADSPTSSLSPVNSRELNQNHSTQCSVHLVYRILLWAISLLGRTGALIGAVVKFRSHLRGVWFECYQNLGLYWLGRIFMVHLNQSRTFSG